MRKETSSSHTGLIVSSVALVVAAVYLLGAEFLIVPFTHAEHRGLIGPSWRLIIFTPINLLAARWPAYEALMSREADFCERLGLWPRTGSSS
jgi:hypothetical protein